MTFPGARLLAACIAALPLCFAFASATARNPDASHAEKTRHHVDRSGKARKGRASYYARRFTGRKMANGERFDPASNAAASKTLPLGTTARVTNLENGRSAEVEIKDRGPYVAGRTVDVTPKTAEELGITEQGVAPVEVAPIQVPQADGTLRPGDGAEG